MNTRIVTHSIFILLLLIIFPYNASTQDFSPLMERGDKAWEGRGQKDAPENGGALDNYLKAIELDPYNYEAHWKATRSLWWISDQLLLSPGGEEGFESRGREGMELSGRAVLIDPEGIEGHLFFALTAIHYSCGIGIIDAMKEELYELIEWELLLCYERDKAYGGGLIPRTLSALYRIAPWPMRDQEKALAFALEAHEISPTSIRNVVYLSAVYDAFGENERAMELLSEASEMDGDREMEPDYKCWKQYAKKCIREGRVIEPERLL